MIGKFVRKSESKLIKIKPKDQKILISKFVRKSESKPIKIKLRKHKIPNFYKLIFS